MFNESLNFSFDILTDQVAKKLSEKGRKLSLTQDDQSGKTKLRHSQSYSFESHGNFVYPWESAIFFLIRHSVMNGFG